PLIVTADQAGVPERSLRDTAWKSFAPRFGLSYRLTDKTVVRGGFGIFYVQLDGNRESEFESVPFLVRENGLLNTIVDGRPINTIQTFLPAGSSFSPTPSLFAHNPRDGNFGYTEQWNLFVQRELSGSFVVDVGYVGTKGNKLQQSREFNAPLPGPGAVQLRRPFPDFATIALSEQSGNSIYHALQAKLERRFSAGLTLMTSFTWSKNIDLNSGNTSTGTDPYSFSLDRGLADWDTPRVLVISSVYQLLWRSHTLHLRQLRTKHSTGAWLLQLGYRRIQGFSPDRAMAPAVPQRVLQSVQPCQLRAAGGHHQLGHTRSD